MFYKHKYFTLNTEDRSVLDENSKKAHVTGNAYLLLEFLCERGKAATLTDVIELLGVRDSFDENNVRQLRIKIRTAIGHDIILYKNQRYSIDGEVVKSETEPEKTANQKFWNKKKIIVAILLCVFVFALFTVLWKNKEILIHVEKPKDQMTFIPAGDFTMGSTEEQAMQAYQSCQEQNQCVKEDYFSEYPQHTVNVPNFYIDTYEVSNADYSLFMKATSHSAPQYSNNSNLNQPNQPVVGVNWNDAKVYCEWLGKRLPIEVEWEKAAQGASKPNHGKGGTPGRDNSDNYEYTAPVGTPLGVSKYGVFNIAGNVSEWVSDDFAPYSENKKFTHPFYNQGLKVVKGGAYDEDQTRQRPQWRNYYEPGNSDIDLGFRCAKDK
ncbi:MAG: SUMF1/EgtB/PvdO family nonheme iron enzyme [Candidatus Parcubacteria bacterium]|nr:SUMF1/EgtB/PvdO family nonheme iron enzyme [Candidatus Parcubacteria bacterium]